MLSTTRINNLQVSTDKANFGEKCQKLGEKEGIAKREILEYNKKGIRYFQSKKTCL